MRIDLYLLLTLIALTLGASSSAYAQTERDIGEVAPDLEIPALSTGEPAAGKRIVQTLSKYRDTQVHHVLYLPTDWRAGVKYPVIVEYAGNGPYRNAAGDVCSGLVEDCRLGYGVGGGKRFIWLCLPYVSADGRGNQRQWWGDVAATVEYCLAAVDETCEKFGGDRDALILAGFSRGAIACNYVGLHDDRIAKLWRGFICHSHYDGVRRWGYAEDDRESAARRLARLGNRPQFISHELSVDATREYLAAAAPRGRFAFTPLGFRNHTDAWVLRDVPERRELRAWIDRTLAP